MDCLRAKEELSAYLDGMLEPEEKRQLERHIEACGFCREELAELKRYAKAMAALPKVKAPKDFLKKVNDRIARRSEFESVIRGFFKPSANKTRAGAVLVTVVAIFAVYRIIAPRFSVYNVEPAVGTRSANVELQKAALPEHKADAVSDAAGLTYEEYMKTASEEIAPVPKARAVMSLKREYPQVEPEPFPGIPVIKVGQASVAESKPATAGNAVCDAGEGLDTVPEDCGSLIYPVGADVDGCADAGGKRYPTTGKGAARWFNFGGGPSEKVYSVTPGERIAFYVYGDDCGDCVCYDADFTLFESNDKVAWRPVQHYEFQKQRGLNVIVPYTPGSGYVMIKARNCFYLDVYVKK